MATRPPIIAPAPRPVTREAHRALAPAARASRPRVVITEESLRARLSRRHGAQRAGDVGSTCHPPVMQTVWGRPAAEPEVGWAVIDVETSGFRPGNARVISLAVLALDPDGQVEESVVSLLNPGVDPGPTHV